MSTVVITGSNQDQFQSGGFLVDVAKEIYGGITRFPKSMEQRGGNPTEEATAWLDATLELALKQGVYSISEIQGSEMVSRLGQGFSTTTHLFRLGPDIKDNSKYCVLKIGSGQAPFPAWPDPNDYRYFEWYKNNLCLLHRYYADSLPFLIPFPQNVFFVEKEDKKATVIIQPFINFELLDYIYFFDSDSQRGILEELQMFLHISSTMFKEHGLLPDYISPRNLGISRYDSTWHLVLVDNGLIDTNANSPIINSIAKLALYGKIPKTLEKLARIC